MCLHGLFRCPQRPFLRGYPPRDASTREHPLRRTRTATFDSPQDTHGDFDADALAAKFCPLATKAGLASRVVPADEVLPVAMDIARDMAVNCSPLVMGLHKKLLWRGHDMDRNALIELETKALHYTMGRADAVEGGMAYFERRQPKWSSSVSREWPEWL